MSKKTSKKRKSLDELETHVSESLTDMSYVHASIREGLVVRNISTLMDHLTNLSGVN